MTLLTAHKILISSAVALFALYSLWELRNYAASDGGTLLRSLGSAAGAAGLALYLRWVWRRKPGEILRK